MIFSNRIRNIEIVASPESCDGCRFVLGHYGEDARKLGDAYRQENPRGDLSVVVFTHDIKPRPEFCTQASVAAILPVIEAILKAMPDDVRKTEAMWWVALCESVSVAYGGKLMKMAGVQ